MTPFSTPMKKKYIYNCIKRLFRNFYLYELICQLRVFAPRPGEHRPGGRQPGAGNAQTVNQPRLFPLVLGNNNCLQKCNFWNFDEESCTENPRNF